jgi:hypothetical protein
MNERFVTCEYWLTYMEDSGKAASQNSSVDSLVKSMKLTSGYLIARIKLAYPGGLGMRLLVVMLALAVLSGASAYGRDTGGSVRALAPMCRAVSEQGSPTDWLRFFRMGECFGAIRVLWTWAETNAQSCVPDRVTLNDVTDVVVAAIAAVPDGKLDSDFSWLVINTLGRQWPCNPPMLGSR